MRYFTFVCYGLLQLFPKGGLPNPLREIHVHEDDGRNGVKGERFRRSIPEFDAVNPMYSDYESLPNQEGSADPHSSGFALSDHLSNIFRSHKSSKNHPKQSSKHASVENAAVSLAKDTESVDGEFLRTDEQEECYRQQNLVPPAAVEPSGKRCSNIGTKNVVGVGGKERASFVRGSFLKERSGKHYEEKEGEKTEITSLYSHPEKAFKPRKVKHYPQPKTPELFKTDGRVYKPVDIDAQFPVYDGDLDVHPDPLQGILDDKYWLDPQDQEAVIRKYMDMAANIVPSDLEIHKRSEPNDKDRTKGVDSKLGYRQSAALEDRCNCKQMVACGDCSKGKEGKKDNITGSYEEGVSNGRKLLSIDYENNIEESGNNDETEILSLQYENIELPNKEGSNEETQIDEHVPIVTMDNNKKDSGGFGGGEKDLMFIRDIEENEDIIEDTRVYLKRKLLWADELEESYEDIDEDKEEYSDGSSSELFKDSDYDSSKINSRQYDESYLSGLVNEPNDEDQVHKVRFSNLENFEKGNVYPKNVLSNYYKSDKLANALQKTLQKKGKGPVQQKHHVNTSAEFESLEREVLKNVSGKTYTTPSERIAHYETVFPSEQNISPEQTTSPEQNTTPEQTTSPEKTTSTEQTFPTNEVISTEQEVSSAENKALKKRWDEYPRHAFKGRRRFVEHDNDKQRVMAFAQSGNDIGGAGVKNAIKTSDTTVTSSPSSSSSKAKSEVTKTTSASTKSDSATVSTMRPTTIDNEKSVEEGIEDARVADNIVSSVLLESQKSSILGHNLGLCRRNESLVKVNYGRVIPETEKVIKAVTSCILERLKHHLAKQSCIILDPELLEFLKWLVITGESYMYYKQRLPRLNNFGSQTEQSHDRFKGSTLPPCDPGSTVRAKDEQSRLLMNPNDVALGVPSQETI